MRVVTLDEYAKLNRTQVDWLVSKLIPRPGLVMLMGPEKAGKSFLALDVGVRVSKGEPVLGYPCNGPRKVLYLQFDTSEAIWRDRIRDLDKSGYDTHAPNLVMVHPDDQLIPFDIVSTKGRDWLGKVLVTARPELVIIDVLREIHTKDENNSTEMKTVGDAIVSAFAGHTVLLVHHTRKLSVDTITDHNIGALSRGSSYITGKMDAYWFLHDGKLQVVNRFDTGRSLRAIQEDSGMWKFPELDNDMILKPALLQLCIENPAVSHNKLADIAMAKHSISRSTYYRCMLDAMCVHRGSQV